MSLVTLADYKIYKKINSTNQDEQLQNILDYVSTYVQSYCGRTLVDNSTAGNELTEYFDANRSVAILSEFPLISVASVKTSLDGGVTQTLLVENTDYFVDLQEDTVLTPTEGSFASATIKHKSLEIVYLAGYVTLPEDLALAVMDLADIHKEGNFYNKKQQSGTSVEFDDTDRNVVPKHIRKILNMYRVI